MDELLEARVDALDRKASKIEDLLYGDNTLSREARQKLKADLAQVYADMATAINRMGEVLISSR